MSFDTERDKTAAIEYMMTTAGWSGWFIPTIQERCKGLFESLAQKSEENDDIKRGWIQALRWVLSSAQAEIDMYKIQVEEAEKSATSNDADNLRADLGFRSPFAINEPGALNGLRTGQEE